MELAGPHMSNTSKKGDIVPKAGRHETPYINPTAPITKSVVGGFKYTEIDPQAEAIVKLDCLLVENEARGTIYYLALGLIAKQSRAKLRLMHPTKKLSELFDEFIGSLRLSANRSPRTIERYMELVEKMVDDGALSGVLSDALKAANFSEEIKSEVLRITDGLGITELYVKYGMVADKKAAKEKGESKVLNIPSEKSPIDEQLRAVLEQIADAFSRARTIMAKVKEQAALGTFDLDKVAPLLSKRASLLKDYEDFTTSLQAVELQLALPSAADHKKLMPPDTVFVGEGASQVEIAR
jgi:hypothetical protein